MRIVVCVNCHAREFDASMERIHTLAALKLDTSIQVITTALPSDRQLQESKNSGVGVWSVPLADTHDRATCRDKFVFG